MNTPRYVRISTLYTKVMMNNLRFNVPEEEKPFNEQRKKINKLINHY